MLFQLLRESGVISSHLTLRLSVHGAFIILHFLELGRELLNLLSSSGGLAVRFFELLILFGRGGMHREELFFHLLEAGLEFLDLLSIFFSGSCFRGGYLLGLRLGLNLLFGSFSSGSGDGLGSFQGSLFGFVCSLFFGGELLLFGLGSFISLSGLDLSCSSLLLSLLGGLFFFGVRGGSCLSLGGSLLGLDSLAVFINIQTSHLFSSVAGFGPGTHVLFSEGTLDLTSSPGRSHSSFASDHLSDHGLGRINLRANGGGGLSLLLISFALSSLGLALLLSLLVLGLDLGELFSGDLILLSLLRFFVSNDEFSSFLLFGSLLLLDGIGLLLLELSFTVGLGLENALSKGLSFFLLLFLVLVGFLAGGLSTDLGGHFSGKSSNSKSFSSRFGSKGGHLLGLGSMSDLLVFLVLLNVNGETFRALGSLFNSLRGGGFGDLLLFFHVSLLLGLTLR